LLGNSSAQSTPRVTIGKNKIVVGLAAMTAQQHIGNIISQVRGNSGCDPTSEVGVSSPIHQTCQTFGILVCNVDATCQQSITVTENYDDANERDCIKGLIQATYEATNDLGDTSLDSLFRTNTAGFEVLRFVQVVLNGLQGANQASMAVLLTIDCEPIKPGDSECNGPLKSVVDGALS
jgi:hypothetical protein